VRFIISLYLLLLTLAAGLGPHTLQAQGPPLEKLFPQTDGLWAEETLAQMTLEEKIGQLFMAPCFTNTYQWNKKHVHDLITKHHIGGVIFMAGSPMRQVGVTNDFQMAAKYPLLIAQDAEWGLSMRLDSTLRFPNAQTLGAIQNDSLLYRYGAELAAQCRAIGVHIDFAPVVDVNNNANNPVINDRSYGENKLKVTRKGLMVMKGLQDNRIMASAKHFPGHGNTDTDSHYDLPVVKGTRKQLDSMELYPFRALINQGVQSVMVAHLQVPAIDNTPHMPASLSPKVISGVLRQDLGFKGLIFSDALNMSGVTKYHAPGHTELAALKAGTDVLLYSENIPLAIKTIKEAILKGDLDSAVVDRAVYKILLAKEWQRLHKERLISPGTVRAKLFRPEATALRAELYRAAVTLAANKGSLLPLADLEKQKMACVQIGRSYEAPFTKTLRKYAPMDVFILPMDMTQAQADTLLQQLKPYNTVVVALMNMSRRFVTNYDLNPISVECIRKIGYQCPRTVLAHFGNPYILSNFTHIPAIMQGFEEAHPAQIACAEAIFGGYTPTGQMPVTVPGIIPPAPNQTIKADRLAFARPDEMGMDTLVLREIDQIAWKYINQKAMPGLTLLVMKDNKVVIEKGYGYTDYTHKQPTDPFSHVYDLASVTKVAATTLAVMKLYDEGNIDLQAPLSRYLVEFEGKGKDHLRVINLLQHNAGLPAWVPFWQQTVKNGQRLPGYFSEHPTPLYCVELGPGLYLRKDVPESVWQQIVDQPVKPNAGVVYSDLGMIIMGKIVERITGMRLDDYLAQTFYRPMGMDHTTYNPALTCKAYDCPPTVEDAKFRFQRVAGYVNDECSAIMGGVTGHAGLFSNAYDLAKLGLMLMQGGQYGGKCYLNPTTIDYFTKATLPNSRRGLGWDKPDLRKGVVNPASAYCSPQTFGHLGFTGTSFWVDPVNRLVFVLLTNRTYPDSENLTFSNEGVRGQILTVVYRSFLGDKPEEE